MTDTDRLAALLIEVFPAANRNQWPFSAMDVAKALIAAGVTLAAPATGLTPDPAEDDRQELSPILPSGRLRGWKGEPR